MGAKIPELAHDLRLKIAHRAREIFPGGGVYGKRNRTYLLGAPRALDTSHPRDSFGKESSPQSTLASLVSVQKQVLGAGLTVFKPSECGPPITAGTIVDPLKRRSVLGYYPGSSIPAQRKFRTRAESDRETFARRLAVVSLDRSNGTGDRSSSAFRGEFRDVLCHHHRFAPRPRRRSAIHRGGCALVRLTPRRAAALR
jgi:hypothetical protein